MQVISLCSWTAIILSYPWYTKLMSWCLCCKYIRFIFIIVRHSVKVINPSLITVLIKFCNSSSDHRLSCCKEARDIVNLLELRKTTLYKIVLIIIERQLSFFVGGELKPLNMASLADELSFAESTISRAVSNKYIESKQGIFPLKPLLTNSFKWYLCRFNNCPYISNSIYSQKIAFFGKNTTLPLPYKD